MFREVNYMLTLRAEKILEAIYQCLNGFITENIVKNV